jgi:hypothetical protein
VSGHPDLVISEVDLSTLSKPGPSGWNLVRDIRREICTLQ